MPQKRPAARAALSRIDPKALAEFQAGIRKRYSNEDILEQLRASAERLGRSPTMREFEQDAETTVHPQTVIQHFGSRPILRVIAAPCSIARSSRSSPTGTSYPASRSAFFSDPNMCQ